MTAALKIAENAVNNEATVVDAAKTIAKVDVKEPKHVSAKTIEKHVEAKANSADKSPAVAEA